MRTVLLRIPFLVAVTAGGAFAQNSDLGLMIGVAHVVNGFTSTTPSSTIDSGFQFVELANTTTSSGTVSAGGQINFAIQLRQNPHLYFELPLHITGASSGTVSNGVSIGSTSAIFYFTPGLRWNFRPTARVSIYGAGGFGPVISAMSAGLASNGVSSASSRVHATAAFEYGLGLDFRLTRLVSLRTEAREAASIGEVNFRHRNDFFTAGVGLHF